MKRFRRIILAAAAVCILLVSGCSPYIVDEGDDGTPIDPIVNPNQNYKTQATLYFKHRTENLLAPDTREISIAPNERIEQAVLRELISGPSLEKSSLVTLINPDTKVVGVQESGDCLNVTLSREFLEPPPYIPQNYYQDIQSFMLKQTVQRLAVLSITNTLLGLHGTQDYSTVLILIDQQGYGEGTRLTREELGFTGENEKQIIEPMGYASGVTLNAQTTVELMFTAMEAKLWDKAFEFVSVTGEAVGGGALDDTEARIAAEGVSVLSHNVQSEAVISADGKRATVFVSYKLKKGDAPETEYAQYPIRLVLENELWAVRYESFMGALRLD